MKWPQAEIRTRISYFFADEIAGTNTTAPLNAHR